MAKSPPRKSPRDYEAPSFLLEDERFHEATVRRLLGGIRPELATDETLVAFAHKHLNHAAILLKAVQAMREAPTDQMALPTLKRLSRLAAELRAELPVVRTKLVDRVEDAPLDGAENAPAEVTVECVPWEAIDVSDKVEDEVTYVVKDEDPDGDFDTRHVAHGIMRLLSGSLDQLMQAEVAREANEKGQGPTAEQLFGAETAEEAGLVLTRLLDVLVGACEAELKRRKTSKALKITSPLKAFVRTAGLVYLRATGQTRLPLARKAETLQSKGGPLQGPLIPFLKDCCQHLGEDVKRETLAKWVQQIRKEPKRGPSHT